MVISRTGGRLDRFYWTCGKVFATIIAYVHCMHFLAFSWRNYWNLGVFLVIIGCVLLNVGHQTPSPELQISATCQHTIPTEVKLLVQLNIDYPTTSGQTTVRRCSDKANVPDKKKLSLTHFQWLLLAARPFYFLLFKIFVFFEWLTTCTVRTLRHVRPKKLLRIIEWSDSRCADNRCSTVSAQRSSKSSLSTHDDAHIATPASDLDHNRDAKNLKEILFH